MHAVIRAQSPPELDDTGTCHDQSSCGDTGVVNLNYGECCGDSASSSFLRNDPFGCFDCPPGAQYSYIAAIIYSYINTQFSAVTCYIEQLNCTGGATIPLTRPTIIEDCCNNGGVSFDNGLECINCPGMQ